MTDPRNRIPTGRKERAALYDRLQERIGRTAMVELTDMDVPNDCRIFAKREYQNPTGSHYDRETVRLLRALEFAGQIKRNRPIVETTTGNSGASIAWLARLLGYECLIFMPADLPDARVEQIRSYGAEVRFTAAGRYVTGLVEEFRDWWPQNHRDYYITNHSMDETHSVAAMQDLGDEILEDLERVGIEKPNYFVAALGNGASSRGVAERLLPRGTTLIGVEPYESPTILEARFPEQISERYPDGPPTERGHEMYGTGPSSEKEIFPNMRSIMPHISEICTPTRDQWAATQRVLFHRQFEHVGHSSAACVWAALELAKSAPPRSVFVTLFYDAAWKYLRFSGQRAPRT
jgi:cysteine synthase